MTVPKNPFSSTGSGSANTEYENSVTFAGAAAHGEQRLMVTGYMALIRGADAGASDVLVTIEDEDDNVLWTDYFAASASRGTRIGMVFGDDSDIYAPKGKGVKLVVAAGGTNVIATSNIMGRAVNV